MISARIEIEEIAQFRLNFGSELLRRFLKVKPIRLHDTMIFQKIFRAKILSGTERTYKHHSVDCHGSNSSIF